MFGKNRKLKQEIAGVLASFIGSGSHALVRACARRNGKTLEPPAQ